MAPPPHDASSPVGMMSAAGAASRSVSRRTRLGLCRVPRTVVVIDPVLLAVPAGAAGCGGAQQAGIQCTRARISTHGVVHGFRNSRFSAADSAFAAVGRVGVHFAGPVERPPRAGGEAADRLVDGELGRGRRLRLGGGRGNQVEPFALTAAGRRRGGASGRRWPPGRAANRTTLVPV